MASDDQTNPYEQPSHWPRMRQGPMRLGPLPKAAPRPQARAAAAPEPAPPPVAPEPAVFFGPTSRSTHPVAPAAIGPSPIEALVRAPYPELRREPEPEPEPAASEMLPDTGPRLGDLGELDLSMPTPAPEALVVPIASRRAKARPRQASRLVPILAASVVALAGAGLLVFLMNAGQQAAVPSPALPVAVASAPVAPVAETAPVSPPLLDTVAPTPTPPVTQPAPRRVASAVRAPAAPQGAPVVAEPPASVLDVPPPEAEAPRITIPPPEPAPAPPPVVRPPTPGPDQPMATHTPD